MTTYGSHIVFSQETTHTHTQKDVYLNNEKKGWKSRSRDSPTLSNSAVLDCGEEVKSITNLSLLEAKDSKVRSSSCVPPSLATPSAHKTNTFIITLGFSSRAVDIFVLQQKYYVLYTVLSSSKNNILVQYSKRKFVKKNNL